MHDYLTGGFTANTSLAHYCRDNGLLLHIHRAMHAVIDRQKNHGMHFRVLAKALRLSGGYHVHSGTVVGKLEGEREITLGFVDLLRDDFSEKDRSRGIYFTQDWVSLPGVLPVASEGIHVWHMPALTEIFGDDSILQFGGGTLGHPWGNAPGAVANRVALEACVQAQNEGRDLAREGNEIIREARKWSPELAAACGNRGRGQIYLNGSKSNNNVYNATATGMVKKIIWKEKRGYQITIVDALDGCEVIDIIPLGPELLVSEGEAIKLDQPLTSNLNVGGFGQGDAEIVLQDPICSEQLKKRGNWICVSSFA
ncbi:hypothetical protein Fmac_018329 [Flemingia macrophylla]|uniref:Cytochrome f n=1 Tax=Flemingia macrophylla TaxID=520843 RepID=A0ABD1M4Q0_9FABA